jgi:hypothetical protein
VKEKKDPIFMRADYSYPFDFKQAVSGVEKEI